MKKEPILFEPEFNLFVKLVLFVKQNFLWVILTLILIAIVGAMYIQFQYQQAQINKIQDAVAPNESKIVVQKFESDKKINEILETLRIELKSDRVKIFQYHNSQRGISGVPFLYISGTHENVAKGVSSEISNLQRLPSSIFSYSLDAYFNNKPICNRIDEFKDSAIQQVLDRQAIVTVCTFPIVYEKEIIGIVEADYNSQLTVDVDVVKTKLSIAAIRINDALEVNRSIY